MSFINLEPTELILIILVAFAVGAFLGKFATEKGWTSQKRYADDSDDCDYFTSDSGSGNYDYYPDRGNRGNSWFA